MGHLVILRMEEFLASSVAAADAVIDSQWTSTRRCSNSEAAVSSNRALCQGPDTLDAPALSHDMASSGERVLSACLEYTAKVLCSVCSIRVRKQVLLSAMQDQGDLEPLWHLVVDLTFIAMTGLHTDTRAGLAAFWQEQANETATATVPMEGALRSCGAA